MSSSSEPELAFRLEFSIADPSRMPALRRIFDALRRIKRIQYSEEEPQDTTWIDSDDPKWFGFLDEPAPLHFRACFDQTSEEAQIWRQLWGLTAPAKRVDPIFNLPGPWEFQDILASIYSAEYELLKLRETSESEGILSYDPHAGPFGGTESLVQLVEAFGQVVTFDSWHEGPHKRAKVGWNPDRARRLVSAGRGVE